MARPTAVDIGQALERARKAAGIRQKDIAEATGRDQTTVSSWLRGEFWPPLEALPVIDELCGQPRGHILRMAGFVDDERPDLEALLEKTDEMNDADRAALVYLFRYYRARRRR